MQNNHEIKFGTDGWRGIISDNFTFANVRRVAQAIAEYYIKESKKSREKKVKIAVGYDNRFLAAEYAHAVSEVLKNNGIDVILSDRAIPTPTLSFATFNKKLTAGVMITASHNPAIYNGIKIKTADGGAAGIDVTKEVERLIVKGAKAPKTSKKGRIKQVDLTKEYIKFLRQYIDLKKLKNAKFKILVDPMYGSGNKLITQVLKGTGIKVEFTRADYNPGFGRLRPEPIIDSLQETQKIMKKGDYDLCLVLDGDADRIACFGRGGIFIYPQKILGLLILHFCRNKKRSGGVVKTIVGSTLVDKICKKLNLKLYETKVGFKYISALMGEEDIMVGGEEAGGMGVHDYIPERDGSLSGILLLEMMAYQKKSISEILKDMEKEFGRYNYLREGFHMPHIRIGETQKHFAKKYEELKKMKSLLGKRVVDIKDYDGVKLICEDESWLMFRGSGTEPTMRTYAEAKCSRKAKRLLDLARKELGL